MQQVGRRASGNDMGEEAKSNAIASSFLPQSSARKTTHQLDKDT